MNVGIIGAGVMGAEHARLLRHEVAGSAVTAVYDLDQGRARATADAVGAAALDDPHAVITDDRVDAVLVASADDSHAEFVLAALAVGKPVLCEKPLAPRSGACADIVAAEVAAGRLLVTVGFMRRFDPGYEQLRAAVRDGSIGAPLLVHCVHRNTSGPAGQPSSNLITGSAVHEFDVNRWLLGEELTRVTVHRGRAARQSGPTRDPLFLVAESEAGTIVDIEVFVNAGYGYEVRCELVGETGTLTLDAPVPTTLRRSNLVGRGLPLDWRPRFAEAYRRELQAWIRSLSGEIRSAELATAWDGYCATMLAEAGVAALEQPGPVPVTLMGKPELYR